MTGPAPDLSGLDLVPVPTYRGVPATPVSDLAAVPPGAVGSASSAASVPEQLIQLDDLRRRGIVTPAEFEAKKAELLGRL